MNQVSDNPLESSSSRIKWKYKSLLLFSGLFGLGLACLAISLLPKVAANPFLASFFGQLSTALIISGLYTGISELVLRQDFIGILQTFYRRIEGDRLAVIAELQASQSQEFQRVYDLFPLKEAREVTGLVALTGVEEYYDQTRWIAEAQELKVLLRDGKSWVSRYNAALKRRFQDADKTTTLLLLDPECPEFDAYSTLAGQGTAAMQYKIASTLEYVRQMETEATQLQVLGYAAFNTYHLVFADRKVMMTLYTSSQLRFKSPSFIFEDAGEQSYYRYLQQDFQALAKTARNIMDYRKA
ncbi:MULTISPECIES: hypothetical protein [Spirulina sp. CCY15215]|uniref:hypothetical protein n=1 Tax=Spirulina sp. CCY15215 TaxID=2767591 RepID=UPI0019501F16|nr:hypothetical protein [Spirulina major]